MANPLNVRVVDGSKTDTTLTLTWDKQTGVAAYRLYRNGKPTSSSWDGSKTTWKTAYVEGDTFDVVAVKQDSVSEIVIGQEPPPPPPPPPPTTTKGARSLPQGPFTDSTAAKWYRTTSGGTVSKQHVHDNSDYGVALMGYFSPAPPAPSTGTWTVTDVIGERIGTLPTHSNGTAEAGLWFGQKVNVTRAAGHGTWMGAWTGCQCADSTITDLTCAILNADGSLGRLPHIGLYLEHCTRRVVFDGLTIKSSGNGVNVEWWYADSYGAAGYPQKEFPGAPAGKGGSWSVEIRNFDIDSSSWGLFLDAGTCDFYIHDGIIRGNNGISHPANLAVPSKPNRIDWTTIDFRGTGTKERIHNNAIG